MSDDTPEAFDTVDADVLARLLPVSAPAARTRADLLAAIAHGRAPREGADAPRHPFPGFTRRFARLFQMTEAAADELLAGLKDPSVWFDTDNVSWFHFEPGVPGGHAGVIRSAAGMPFPRHRHVGEEHSLILRGAVRDDVTGERYLPGDLLVMPPGSPHAFSIEPADPAPGEARAECWFAVLMIGEWPEFELD